MEDDLLAKYGYDDTMSDADPLYYEGGDQVAGPLRSILALSHPITGGKQLRNIGRMTESLVKGDPINLPASPVVRVTPEMVKHAPYLKDAEYYLTNSNNRAGLAESMKFPLRLDTRGAESGRILPGLPDDQAIDFLNMSQMSHEQSSKFGPGSLADLEVLPYHRIGEAIEATSEAGVNNLAALSGGAESSSEALKRLIGKRPMYLDHGATTGGWYQEGVAPSGNGGRIWQPLTEYMQHNGDLELRAGLPKDPSVLNKPARELLEDMAENDPNPMRREWARVQLNSNFLADLPVSEWNLRPAINEGAHLRADAAKRAELPASKIPRHTADQKGWTSNLWQLQ